MRAGLFWNIASVEARKRMSYRADFWINSLAGIAVTFSVFWFLTYAMFAASGKTALAGYTPRGMVLYYVFVALIGRMIQSNTMDLAIAQNIYDGSLSRYLLYPTSYGAMKYAEQAGALAPQLVQLLVLGAVVPLVIGIPPEVHITPATVLMCLASLVLANALNYLLVFPIQAVAFWADNVWSLAVAYGFVVTMLGGMLLPLTFFPEWVRGPLRWTPFPYLYSIPVRTLMGEVPPTEWALGLAIALFWCGAAILIGRIIWRRGDLQYTGVGI